MMRVPWLPLLLLLFSSDAIEALGGCLSQLPMHATTNNTAACLWECDAGFYKTDTLLSTCRPCAPVEACAIGWQLRPCAANADAACVPCPALPLESGKMYFASTTMGCDNNGTTICREGFYSYYNNDGACRPCEKGFYCEQSAPHPQQCGVNCTIPNEGASNILECQQPSQQQPNEDAGFAITFMLSLPQSRATALVIPKNLTTCPELDTQMQGWVKYGTFYGCFLSMTTTMGGTLACQVSAAPCIAGQYMQWLAQLSHRQFNAISAIIRNSCLPTADWVIGVPLVQSNSNYNNLLRQQQLAKMMVVAANSDPHKVMSAAAMLVFAKQPWGVRKTLVLNMLGGVVAVVFALLLLLLCFCGLACFRIRTKRIMATLYEKLADRHEKLMPHDKSLAHDKV